MTHAETIAAVSSHPNIVTVDDVTTGFNAGKIFAWGRSDGCLEDYLIIDVAAGTVDYIPGATVATIKGYWLNPGALALALNAVAS